MKHSGRRWLGIALCLAAVMVLVSCLPAPTSTPASPVPTGSTQDGPAGTQWLLTSLDGKPPLAGAPILPGSRSVPGSISTHSVQRVARRLRPRRSHTRLQQISRVRVKDLGGVLAEGWLAHAGRVGQAKGARVLDIT